jgi:hypothetical protein
MKDQYFGDVNDYRKYGLLRALQSIGNASLLAAWMLTPDDGGRDGGMRSYLDDADQWAKYDRGLFIGMTDLLRTAEKPRVSLMEGSGLLPRTKYYSAVVSDAHQERFEWRQELFRAAAGVDLVFLDPDNGIEVPSKPVGCAGSSKYVTWSEIKGIWDADCSILIYQHFRRENRKAFSGRLTAELRSRIGAPFVEAFRTPHVLFLLAGQKRHAQWFGNAIPLMQERWGNQISVMKPANNS